MSGVRIDPVQRPPVDVVVPFAGTRASLEALLDRLGSLRLGPGDSITVADNRTSGAPAPTCAPGTVRLIRVTERPSAYLARNQAIAAGAAPWVLLLDADVAFPETLIDAYYSPPPNKRTAILAGALVDRPPGPGTSAVVRYAALRQSMAHESTLGHGRWAYALAGNCAIRREALERVGGFRTELRSGGDADLSFRLLAAGWKLERRQEAMVIHHGPQTLRGLASQRARHGSGAAWLNRTYPGSFPPQSWPGLVKWTAGRWAGGIAALASGRSDEALVSLIEPVEQWAFEIGRLMPNRPTRRQGREHPDAR